jgi:hypothetical protein
MASKKKVSSKSVNPIRVGNAVLIRCVTHYHTGRIVEITPTELVLTDAAWIGDTGRFHTALSTGSLSEVEPFTGPVAVSRGAIVDVTTWTHELPRLQK